jgi:surface antigen
MIPARLALLLALAATSGAACHEARAGDPSSPPVTAGYAYASRCPSAGIADDVDRWRLDMCNCTSYVAWALQANGQRIDWFVAGSMDAWNWPHVARLAGLTVGTRPVVGSVAVWPNLSPPFGHVAYVTGVDRDGGIDVSEYNRPGAPHPFAYDRRADVDPVGAVFIYVPKTPPSARRRLSTLPRRRGDAEHDGEPGSPRDLLT